MTFSDGLAVAAIALSFFTIFLGVLFYKWQGDLAREMHSLLGEVRTRTSRTEEELQAQFKLVLEAALGQQRASIGQELEERVETIEQRVAAVEEKSPGTGDEEFRTVLGELKRDVGGLQRDLAVLRQGPPPAGRDLPTDREAALAIAQDFLNSGRGSLPLSTLPLSIEPGTVEPGGRVRLRQPGAPPAAVAGILAIGLRECEVTTPDGRVLTAPWSDPAQEVVFPDDFPYGSTELVGTYRVAVRHKPFFSITAGGREAVVRGSFRVRSSESHD